MSPAISRSRTSHRTRPPAPQSSAQCLPFYHRDEIGARRAASVPGRSIVCVAPARRPRDPPPRTPAGSRRSRKFDEPRDSEAGEPPSGLAGGRLDRGARLRRSRASGPCIASVAAESATDAPMARDIEAATTRKRAVRAEPSVGGLRPNLAAQRTRAPDRAVGVGAELRTAHGRRDRVRPEPPAEPPSCARVMRVSRGPVVRVSRREVVGVFPMLSHRQESRRPPQPAASRVGAAGARSL